MFASGLPLVARLLVWAIVLGGLVAFIWRRLQGVPLRGKPKVGADSPEPGLPIGPPPTMSAAAPIFPPAVPPSMPPASPPTAAPLAGPIEAVAPTALPPTSVPPALGAPGTATPSDPGVGNGTTARTGFFAPAVDGPASSSTAATSTPATGRPTVAEALQGVVMPCGLSPVVDGSSSLPNPFRVLFLTNLAPAPEVGRSLADELERLGFTLSTAAATELMGRRGAAELRVVLYPTAASARRGLEQLFPAAGPGAVGVELST